MEFHVGLLCSLTSTFNRNPFLDAYPSVTLTHGREMSSYEAVRIVLGANPGVGLRG